MAIVFLPNHPVMVIGLSDEIARLIGTIDSFFILNGVESVWQQRMKALAFAILIPGSDETIEDMDALDCVGQIPSWHRCKGIPAERHFS